MHTVMIAGHFAKGCCTATAMAITFIKQKSCIIVAVQHSVLSDYRNSLGLRRKAYGFERAFSQSGIWILKLKLMVLKKDIHMDIPLNSNLTP